MTLAWRLRLVHAAVGTALSLMKKDVTPPHTAVSRRLMWALLALGFMGLAAGCARDTPKRSLIEINGETMGTTYTVKVVDAPKELDSGELSAAIIEVLERIDRYMSTYRSDSILSRFNSSASVAWRGVPIELITVIDAARRVSVMTEGVFDVTVGSLVNQWGFGARASTAGIPSTGMVAAALADVGYSLLHTRRSPPAIRKDRPALNVDLSGIAKGYAVDRLGELLASRGVENYLVEIGGELKVRGRNAAGGQWAIAIEQPAFATRRLQRMIYLTEAGVATSGDYRNFIELDGRVVSHAIDPRTGAPAVSPTASVTVIHQSAMYADAMATALLVAGADHGYRLAEKHGVAALFFVRHGSNTIEQATTPFTAYLNPGK